LGSERIIDMELALSSNTVNVLSGDDEYEETSSIKPYILDRPQYYWGLGKGLPSRIKGESLRNSGISAWSAIDYEVVIESTAEDEALNAQLERERLENSIRLRIQNLERLAYEEGITPSEKSGTLLVEFFKKRMIDIKPSIFLLENGNYRAVWNNEENEQLGLQFFSDGNIQFVIFAKRNDSSELARSYGIDTPEALERIVEANRLRHLLYS